MDYNFKQYDEWLQKIKNEDERKEIERREIMFYINDLDQFGFTITAGDCVAMGMRSNPFRYLVRLIVNQCNYKRSYNRKDFIMKKYISYADYLDAIEKEDDDKDATSELIFDMNILIHAGFTITQDDLVAMSTLSNPFRYLVLLIVKQCYKK